VGLRLKKSHQLIADLQGFLRIVGDAEFDQEIGETHDAEADLSCLFGMCVDGRKGKVRAFEHVIQEADGERNDGL
jgi:hypothetical protein